MRTKPLLQGPVWYTDVPADALPYVVWREQLPGPGLFVCASMDRALEVFQQLKAWMGSQVCLFPGGEHTVYEERSPHVHDAAQRNTVRHALTLASEESRSLWVVAPVQALLRRWMPSRMFEQACLRVQKGGFYNRETCVEALLCNGFLPSYTCEDPGTFAVRGGVLDVWPVGSSSLIRLDFFGDEVDSIKKIHPHKHTVEKPLDSWVFHPMREVWYTSAQAEHAQKKLLEHAQAHPMCTGKIRSLKHPLEQRHTFVGMESLWPCFYPSTEAVTDTLLPCMASVVLEDTSFLWKALETYREDVEKTRLKAQENAWPVLPVEAHLAECEEIKKKWMQKAQVCSAQTVLDPKASVKPHGLQPCQEVVQAMATALKDGSGAHPADVLEQHARNAFEHGRGVLLVVENHVRAERIQHVLHTRGMHVKCLEGIPSWQNMRQGPHGKECVYVCVSHMQHSFQDTLWHWDVWVESEWKPAVPKKHTGAKHTHVSFSQGDHVVHPLHGIGLYDGLHRLVLHGVDGDYALLWYANKDKLYVPVYHMGVLKPYVSAQKNIVLDTLGGTAWDKTTQKVKDHVLHLAHELIATQAQRSLRKGLPVKKLDDTFQACVQSFPYQTTPDQQKAIDDVLNDLTSGKAMDRLVCGDVGFGKTEVAVRAAYAMVLSGYQVAVLVPTTLLAEQHMLTFQQRLASLGVSVEVLSRMQKNISTHNTLQGLKAGSVDVVVGTHRMLSPDVQFKKLGLLVIDEEQRFGVRHKEHMKKFKADVHVLTMSATPIPRTLHWATSGLKDISLIQTPPEGRLDIHTEVLSMDEDVIKEAVNNELRRGGQVYVVHHRVEDLYAWETVFKGWFPKAAVACAHGQMKPQALERVMMDFIRQKHHILLCTSIIENGIDIPSANTMLVLHADMFGLSQLHQLRGRIGRADVRGYAYLLVADEENTHPVALKRLALLKKWSSLGAGMHIAAHDLDMRGAGHLLGKDQSGHVASVGFELYTQLLQEAVAYVRGNPDVAHIEPEIRLPVPAVLPSTYIKDSSERLRLYQEFIRASSDEETLAICDRIEEVYGPPPVELGYVVSAMAIRRFLKTLGASFLEVKQENQLLQLSMAFAEHSKINRNGVVESCIKEPHKFRMSSSGKWVLSFPWDASLAKQKMLEEVLSLLRTVPLLHEKN
jgi:transcription-repair coupling factor (superfamily II helicase)